jgi:chromosome condensin MukBEF ATPase and DNA-binding subunit MukB
MTDWRDNAAEQNLRLAQEMLEQQGEINKLKAELADYRALFDLQFTRMQEASALWRAEAPEERYNVMPDLGELLTWLMERGAG